MNEHVLTEHTISCAAAQAIIDRGIQHATSTDRAMVLAVVDAAGVLKAYARMDGAPQLSVGIAQDKAYTAASFGIPTDQWFDFIKDDPPLLHGIVHTPRLVTFGGGYPIIVDGTVVGGLGVSGGHYSDDMDVAQAALTAVSA